MNATRMIFEKIAAREREICARIAEEISRQCDLAGDEGGASAACQIATCIREEGIPEIRQAYMEEVRHDIEVMLQRGPLQVMDRHASD